MIASIRLPSFGKFSGKLGNTKFQLDRLTIFTGPNEAGKSTIFDAIFNALCSPKATGSSGRALRDRYGNDRQVELTWDGPRYSMTESDFLDICSISSERQAPRLDSDGGWIQDIKSKLFSGGINPGLILERLEKRASTKGSLKHNRELQELRQQEDALLKRQKELEQQRESSLHALNSAIQSETKINELEKTIGELKEELGLAQAKDHQYALIADRDKMRSELTAANEILQLEQQLKSLNIPDSDAMASLKSIQSTIEENEKQLYSIQRMVQDKQQELDTVQNEIHQMEKAAITQGSKTAMAEQILEKLDAIPPANSSQKGSALAVLLPLILLVPGLAGIIGGLLSVLKVFSPGPLIGYSLLASGLLLGALGTALLFKFHGRRNAGKQKSDSAVPKEYDLLASEAWHSLQIERGSNLRPALESLIQQANNQQQQLLFARRRQEDIQLRLNELHVAAATAEEQGASHRSALSALLDQFGCSAAPELQQRIREADTAGSRLAELQDRLRPLMQRLEIKEISILASELARKIGELEQQITEDSPSEAQTRAVKQQIQSLESRLEQQTRQINELQLEHQRHKTIFDSRFGDIPSSFLQLESEIQGNRSRQKELVTQRQAAQLASDIIAEMNQDNSRQLEEISRKVESWFGDILDATRKVQFEGFDQDQIKIQDAGGTLRNASNLSSGTRDAFYLAARLALIAESSLADGLVILDDPFVTMDETRIKQAAAVIERFHDTSKHQIIIFSKDENLPSIFRIKYLHHSLSRSA